MTKELINRLYNSQDAECLCADAARAIEALQARVKDLLTTIDRKDAALRVCLDACKCILDQVMCPPAEVDYAIEAITKELTK